MERRPGEPLSTEQLLPEELARVRARNEAESQRQSTMRIYEVEATRTYPNRVEFDYGFLSFQVYSEGREQVKPGTKLLFVQQSEFVGSPIKGVYVLGKNLSEKE